MCPLGQSFNLRDLLVQYQDNMKSFGNSINDDWLVTSPATGIFIATTTRSRSPTAGSGGWIGQTRVAITVNTRQRPPGGCSGTCNESNSHPVRRTAGTSHITCPHCHSHGSPGVGTCSRRAANGSSRAVPHVPEGREELLEGGTGLLSGGIGGVRISTCSDRRSCCAASCEIDGRPTFRRSRLQGG